LRIFRQDVNWGVEAVPQEEGVSVREAWRDEEGYIDEM
jgi:hypothetical protein